MQTVIMSQDALVKAESNHKEVSYAVDGKSFNTYTSNDMYQDNKLILKIKNVSNNWCVYLTIDNIVKEDKSLLVNESQSPPISVRLKELAMNLQVLYSTPLSLTMPRVATTRTANIIDTMGPKTPIVTRKMDFPNCPWGAFNKRSSRMKVVITTLFSYKLI